MGFEPMVRSRESLVFKTSSINHSDTSPQCCRQNAGIIIQKYGGVVNPSAQTFLKIISHVNLTVNFLLCFVRVVFVLDKKRKNRRSVTPRRENFRGLFYSAQGVKPSLPSTWTFV